MGLNPRLLTRKPLDIVKEEGGAPACGTVSINPQERPNPVYHIKIFLHKCRQMFRQSLVYGIIPYHSFEMAVLIHEISHVMGETLDYDYPVNNFVIGYISNVLDDSRDEYNLMWQRP